MVFATIYYGIIGEDLRQPKNKDMRILWMLFILQFI